MNGSVEACITARPFKGTARLDPRTKFLLLIFLGCVSYFVNGELTSLALVSGVAIFIAGGSRPRTAAKMLAALSVFGVTVLKIIPIAGLGFWILATTPMDDLTVAMQRMHMPQAVTIPLVVMFRYIPTLGIEYRQIKNAMAIRGISDTYLKRIAHPVRTVEYILVPLLMRCLKVTDELAASGTTRGLELDTRREALNEVRMGAGDWLAIAFGMAFFTALVLCDRSALGELVVR